MLALWPRGRAGFHKRFALGFGVCAFRRQGCKAALDRVCDLVKSSFGCTGVALKWRQYESWDSGNDHI